MPEIMQLSWQTQLVIVSGYLAYVIAFTGRRIAHTTTDTVAIILCFGGIGLFAMNVSERVPFIGNTNDPLFLSIFALVTPVVLGVAWRRNLGEWCRVNLAKLSQNEDDGLPSAWETIIQTQGLNYSQIIVTLNNGTVLESFGLEPFNNFPNGPCTLGSDGSIALYVTHIQEPDSERREVKDIKTNWGSRITYVPSSQIREIDLRRSPKEK